MKLSQLIKIYWNVEVVSYLKPGDSVKIKMLFAFSYDERVYSVCSIMTDHVILSSLNTVYGNGQYN